MYKLYIRCLIDQYQMYTSCIDPIGYCAYNINIGNGLCQNYLPHAFTFKPNEVILSTAKLSNYSQNHYPKKLTQPNRIDD